MAHFGEILESNMFQFTPTQETKPDNVDKSIRHLKSYGTSKEQFAAKSQKKSLLLYKQQIEKRIQNKRDLMIETKMNEDNLKQIKNEITNESLSLNILLISYTKYL